MPVSVVTDSACDLPDEILDELGIRMVPLEIRFGDRVFVDRRDLTPAEFWRMCAEASELPSTAAPSPGDFEAAFRSAASEGADAVVCVNLSGALSATIEAARAAARALAGELDVRVVDSRSVSMGLGMMVVEAARLAREGAGPDDVERHVSSLIARTEVYAALDTLENLRKGGRIGGAQAFLGSLLQIKPIIAVRDGEVHAEARQRTRTKALAYLADKVAEAEPVDNLAVMHADVADIDRFIGRLEEIHPGPITVGQIGAVIGAHAGPGTVGVVFQRRAG